MFPWAKLPKSLGRVGESLWRSRLPGLGAFDCEPSAGKPPPPSHPCLSWRGAAYQSHWIRVPPLALTVCRVVVLAPPDIARETRLERGGKRVPAPQLCCWVGLAAAGPEVPSSAACEDSDRPACLRFPASTGAETVSLPSSTCQSSSGAVCFFPGLLQLAGRTSKKSV